MNGGVFVYVPKGVQVEVPLQTIFWQEDHEVALFNHVRVVAEENSSLTYVENYISNNKDEETVSNVVAEVFVHDNTHITFGGDDDFAAGTAPYIECRGVAGNDAVRTWALGHM